MSMRIGIHGGRGDRRTQGGATARYRHPGA
jgi:hypothetical protein